MASNNPYWWCDTCCRVVIIHTTTEYDDNEIPCPRCNTGFLEHIIYRRLSLAIPFSIAGPPTSSRSEEDYLLERIILIDPLNQATVVPSTNLDGLLIRFIRNEIPGLFGQPPPPSSSSTMPASEESVNAMATVKVEDREALCPVCLEGFGGGGDVREMPCKHGYHEGCILKWLEKHNTCPVCRFQMPVQENKPVAVADRVEEREEEEEMRSRRRRVVLSLTLVIAELVSTGRRTSALAEVVD